MEYNKSLLIIYQGIMQVGGIENYVYKLAKDFLSYGGTVILHMKRGCIIDNEYGDIIKHPSLYVTSGLLTPKDVRKCCRGKEISCIKILSFTALNFTLSDMLKRSLSKKYQVDTFFCIPHFVGRSIYLEDGYSGNSKYAINKRYGNIIGKLNNNDCIRYFAKKHLETMTKRYSFSLKPNESDCYIPHVVLAPHVFNEKRVRELWRREQFNILTISRFEFPHKGYIIGLVDAFELLKEKYPKITLTICGYGVSQGELMDRISKLNEKVKKDVRLIGKTAPDKLVDLYNDANLNISVAGCYHQGVANGTLSLPARHYSYKCEVYGFSPEANAFSLGEEQGQPVIPFIEKVINMPEEEYVSRCEASFLSIARKSISDSRLLHNASNFTNKSVLNLSDIIFMIKDEIRFHIIYHLRRTFNRTNKC